MEKSLNRDNCIKESKIAISYNYEWGFWQCSYICESGFKIMEGIKSDDICQAHALFLALLRSKHAHHFMGLEYVMDGQARDILTEHAGLRRSLIEFIQSLDLGLSNTRRLFSEVPAHKEWMPVYEAEAENRQMREYVGMLKKSDNLNAGRLGRYIQRHITGEDITLKEVKELVEKYSPRG